MNRVKDKVAVITGGASGLGEASCLLLAKEGAQVAVTDINQENGQKVVDKIKAEGGHAHFWQLDTSNEQEAKLDFKSIYDYFGKINILVNNAGITGVNKPTHELTEQEWDEVVKIDMKGVFFCTKHAIPYLKKSGGSIINISSIDGIIGEPDFPPYHASKAAVRVMSKTDALIYAKDNIRVNSIHPGYIWTPLMQRQAAKHPKGIEDFLKMAKSLHPIGHLGEPNDIAYGVLYLASDESKFITGSELIIDGGFTAK